MYWSLLSSVFQKKCKIFLAWRLQILTVYRLFCRQKQAVSTHFSSSGWSLAYFTSKAGYKGFSESSIELYSLKINKRIIMHFYSFWLHFSLPRNLGQEELILKLGMWHETKQTRTILPAQTATSSGLCSVWPVGFILFFYFFVSCAGMAWIMIPNTYDNVQSWVNSGELDFSFISSTLAALHSKKPKAYLLSILHLYVWWELLMPLGHSIAATQLTNILQVERFSLQPRNWMSNICINRETI